MNFSALFKAFTFFTQLMVIIFVTVESISVDFEPSGKKSSATTDNLDLRHNGDNGETINNNKSGPVHHTILAASVSDESKNNAQKNISALSMKREITSYLLSIRSGISPETYDYLSTDVLSEVDLFRYSMRKTKNSSLTYIMKVILEVNNLLNSNTLPESYIPYVRALRSILRIQIKLAGSKEDILKIQKTCLANLKDCSSIPSDILSPPELSGTGLFSYDIVSDPNPPLRLFNKLVRIPKISILNLRTRLENFNQRVEKSYKFARQVWWPYTWYGRSLRTCVDEESVFDELRRDMNYLQLVSTAAKNSIHDDRIENETN
ncbi:uncharacterized protein LOC135847818 [Planococcus citri]|uniref:uncharacterized protein LOC135847818 n=1 Tax=Planococcus citri TaxID=170843 RepID=UPI0031F91856